MRWDVPSEWDGERADKVLARLSGCSRAMARRALETGAVTVNGAKAEPRRTMAVGDTLQGEIIDETHPLEPEPIEFGVVFEDGDVAVVDKPPGLVTHPGAGNRRGTLAAGILYRWPQVRGVGAEDRWGIVHRLDRDTSGLLVVALTEPAYVGLSEAIRTRSVEREYLALVEAVPTSPTGTIEAPLGRDRRRPTRVRVDSEGRPAVTHFSVEEQWERSALLRVRLETGRTHQIRVHLASIGLPVSGDRVYGSGVGTSRLFLHATRLAFTHPVTAEPLQFSSPLPPDLAEVVAARRAVGGL